MNEHRWFGIVDGNGDLELALYPTAEAAQPFLGWTDGQGGGPGAKARVVRVTVREEEIHDSDCAVYNEPAYPAGRCDCGIDSEPLARCIEQLEAKLKDRIDKVDDLMTEGARQQDRIEQLEADLENRDQQLMHRTAATAALEKELQGKNRDLFSLRAENERLAEIERDRDAVCDSYATENQKFYDEKEALRARVERLEAQLKALEVFVPEEVWTRSVRAALQGESEA